MRCTSRLRSRVMVALAVVASALLAAGSAPAVASPVLDDEALVRGFAKQMGVLADAGSAIDGVDAGKGLAEAEGRTTTIPKSVAGHAVTPAGPVYDAVLPAVVAVGSVYKCDRCSEWHLGGLASGWIVSPDGLVVTNHHVLEREASHRFGVMTSDGEVYAITAVVASDPGGDAAVVRIDGRGRKFPCLAVGEPPPCGAPLSVIGHPKGRFWCLTEGVVSRYHRQQRRDRGGEAVGRPAVWMSVTADYAEGSSGGPVLDAAGRVVGMVSRTATRVSRSNLAGPANPGAPVPPQPEQMIFKDCVSADTLRALLGAAEDRPPGS